MSKTKTNMRLKAVFDLSLFLSSPFLSMRMFYLREKRKTSSSPSQSSLSCLFDFQHFLC